MQSPSSSLVRSRVPGVSIRCSFDWFSVFFFFPLSLDWNTWISIERSIFYDLLGFSVWIALVCFDISVFFFFWNQSHRLFDFCFLLLSLLSMFWSLYFPSVWLGFLSIRALLCFDFSNMLVMIRIGLLNWSGIFWYLNLIFFFEIRRRFISFLKILA